jgi:hypothetical protein
VVYSKRPFGGPEQVYRYLGRYTHRVAISNARLVKHRTTARSSSAPARRRPTTLAPIEFVRRFLDHVLPNGFVKIRHFGLLASVNVKGRLEHARSAPGRRPFHRQPGHRGWSRSILRRF